MYKIPTTSATEPKSKNSIAVAGFIDQFARRADLKSFLQSFRSDMDDTTTFTTQELDGGKNSQGASQAGVEAVRLLLLLALNCADLGHAAEPRHPVHHRRRHRRPGLFRVRRRHLPGRGPRGLPRYRQLPFG